MKRESQKGALTIEASISYSIFLMVIVTVLYIMRIVYTFGLIQHAVNQTAKELSAYTYVYQVTGLNDINQGLRPTHRTEQFNKDVDSIVKLYEALTGGNYDGAHYDGTTNPVEIIKNMGGALLDKSVGEVNNLAFTLIARPMVGGYIGADGKGNSAGARLEALRVVNGLAGLDFSASHFFEDGATIDLVVCYTIDPIFPIDVIPELHLVNRAYVKGMTGASVFE